MNYKNTQNDLIPLRETNTNLPKWQKRPLDKQKSQKRRLSRRRGSLPSCPGPSEPCFHFKSMYIFCIQTHFSEQLKHLQWYTFLRTKWYSLWLKQQYVEQYVLAVHAATTTAWLGSVSRRNSSSCSNNNNVWFGSVSSTCWQFMQQQQQYGYVEIHSECQKLRMHILVF